MVMIYFQNRTHAGELLAEKLVDKYRYENTTVLALDPGAVVIGQAVAAKLHTTLSLLLIEPIEVPGSHKTAVGMLNQRGDFVYNDGIPTGVIEELELEFRSVIEQEKIEKMHKMNRLLGSDGIADPVTLQDHTVIVISQGLMSGVAFDAVYEYLKPLRVEKLVGAVPIASVDAVDRLHILCDEIHVLDVVPETFKIEHYYEEEEDLSQERISSILSKIVLNWQ